MTQTACNLETGAITGNVENLQVISKKSEKKQFQKTLSASASFAIGLTFPIPKKFGFTESSEVGKFVEKTSGLHCRGSIKEK